ncbi:uncharacterized protein PG986_012963 [Apiospora aurea]|uniref:Uncharacterized protein n=1 Tax=Apiospora aurea TaxID=335848 RepID=A0ABR1Q1P1_9PEZI
MKITDIFTILGALSSLISSLVLVYTFFVYVIRFTSRARTAEEASEEAKKRARKDIKDTLALVPNGFDRVVEKQDEILDCLREIRDSVPSLHGDRPS